MIGMPRLDYSKFDNIGDDSDSDVSNVQRGLSKLLNGKGSAEMIRPDIEGSGGPRPPDPSRLKNDGMMTQLLPPASVEERVADEAREARTPTQRAARELWRKSLEALSRGDEDAYVSLAVDAALLDEKGCPMKIFIKDGKPACEPKLLAAAQRQLAHVTGERLAGTHALCALLLLSAEPARARKHLDDAVSAAPIERVLCLRSAVKAQNANLNDESALKDSLADLYAARDKAPRTAEGDRRRRTYGHCASKLLLGLNRVSEATRELQNFIDCSRDSDDEYEKTQTAKALYEIVPHSKHAQKCFDRAEEVHASLPQHLREDVKQARAIAQLMLNAIRYSGTGHMGGVRRFQVGEAVEVAGLSRTEYNGQQGTVKAVRDDGRREVLLESGHMFAVKVSNLVDPAESQIAKSKAKIEKEAKKAAAASPVAGTAAEFERGMTSAYRSILGAFKEKTLKNPLKEDPGGNNTAYSARCLHLLRETTNVDQNAGDPFGNGDQSFVPMPDTKDLMARGANMQEIMERVNNSPFQRLRTLWSEGFDFNPEREADFSPMMVACFCGRLKAVRELLDRTDVGSSNRAELLNMRESTIRMSPLLGTITGSRLSPALGTIVGSPWGASEHVDVAKLLLQARADVHAKDVAGFSVLHHCCTIYASDTSLQIARLCAQHGADPNAMNRFGELPLFEPVMNCKHGIVRVLCESRADPARKGKDGTTAFSLASLQPDMLKVFSDAMKVVAFPNGTAVTLHGLVKVELNGCRGVVNEQLLTGRLQVCLADGRHMALKPENLKAVEQGACAACGDNRAKLKECSDCREVGYCSQSCQKAHWKTHKPHCREASGRARITEVAIDPRRPLPGEENPLFGARPQGAAMAPGSKGASGFIVKVQVPLSDVGYLAFTSGGQSDSALRIYDAKRSFDTLVGPDQEPAFTTLRTKVREEGINGCKGYFNARLAEDGLVHIISARLVPPQAW